MKIRDKTTLLLASAAVFVLPSFADAATEEYVQINASEVLSSLNDPSLSGEDRTKKFNAYMDEFTDMNAVANFAIGKYSRRFSEDEMTRYRVAFRTYALSVYENELDAYRGEAVVVKNSVDRSANDSIVNTVIKRADGQDMDVRWRVLTRKGEYQVVDVALNLDGNLIWLGIEQRAQFLSLLDRTNGDANALIDKINSMTKKLEDSRAN